MVIDVKKSYEKDRLVICTASKYHVYAKFRGGDNMNKKWLKAAAVRAVKTMAQTALSLMTVGNMVTDMNWLAIISISLTAGISSVLTSITGLPEIKENDVT